MTKKAFMVKKERKVRFTKALRLWHKSHAKEMTIVGNRVDEKALLRSLLLGDLSVKYEATLTTKVGSDGFCKLVVVDFIDYPGIQDEFYIENTSLV